MSYLDELEFCQYNSDVLKKVESAKYQILSLAHNLGNPNIKTSRNDLINRLHEIVDEIEDTLSEPLYCNSKTQAEIREMGEAEAEAMAFDWG